MHPWNKVIKRIALGAVAAVFLAVLLTRAETFGKGRQPIAFNHKKHVQRHVACAVCHPLYKTHTRAGIPGVKTCIRCHEEVIFRMPEKEKIQAYREAGTEIPWTRVYRAKPDTYGLDKYFAGIPGKILDHIYGGKNPINFSHRRHTTLGKVDCSECHGDVAGMEIPLTKPLIPIEMPRCLACHEKQREKVSVDCADCHR